MSNHPWLECAVVAASLVITLAIGLYFSKRGKSSLAEYMLGSRQMTVLPISLSIAATFLSGSSMVSSAQEVYLYGMQVAFAPWIYAVYGAATAWIYLPVSYSIKSASCFEFFDRRFNAHLRKFASIVYALETIQHTAMSQYIPAISLSQATGFAPFPIACGLSIVCLVCTAPGGLRAVAWADSFQAACFVLSSIILFFIGLSHVGGPYQVWLTAVEGSRMEYFNFDASPSVRYTIPSLLIGSIVLCSGVYLAPSYHQRVRATPTFEQARKTVMVSSLLSGVFLSFTYCMGIVVFAYYSGCDPLLAKKGLRSYATILPYFVSEMSKNFPGIEGLFLAGVTAAGLSTTTSCWNTVACTLYEDLVKPCVGRELPQKTSYRILMFLVVTTAIVSTSFILVIQNLNSILEATISLKAITLSMNFILYNGGMFLPWVNSKGIMAGSLSSGALTLYIVYGSQQAKKSKLVKDLTKILTTSQCIVNGTYITESLNMTISSGTTGYGLKTVTDPSIPLQFRLGFMLYMIPGAFLGLIVSYVVSRFTGSQDLATVDREMIVPQMRWVLPKPRDTERQQAQEMKEYQLVSTSSTVY